MDLTAAVPHLPQVGETIQATGFNTYVGGKALNQAVAVQRLGGEAVLAGRVGEDGYGRTVLEFLESEGIEAGLMEMTDQPTGMSLIAVEEGSGENTIITVAGANLCFAAGSLDWDAEPLASCGTALFHWDLPQPLGEDLLWEAKKAGKRVMLSLAPFGPISQAGLEAVDILTVNGVEAEQLTGVDTATRSGAAAALEAMARRGVNYPVLTMGASGAAALVDGEVLWTAAPEVKAVDTVGAGDTFVGALARFLDVVPWAQALSLAVHAASLAVTVEGVSGAIPYWRDLPPAT